MRPSAGLWAKNILRSASAARPASNVRMALETYCSSGCWAIRCSSALRFRGGANEGARTITFANSAFVGGGRCSAPGGWRPTNQAHSPSASAKSPTALFGSGTVGTSAPANARPSRTWRCSSATESGVSTSPGSRAARISGSDSKSPSERSGRRTANNASARRSRVCLALPERSWSVSCLPTVPGAHDPGGPDQERSGSRFSS